MQTASPAAGWRSPEKVDKSIISKNENAFMISPLPSETVDVLEVDGIPFVCVTECVCA